MAHHNDIGVFGEKMAVEYLKNKGYMILVVNYRFRHLEIDIIAEHDNQLVVVEVKTRQSDYLAEAGHTVSRSKQKGIIKAANAYIHEHKIDLDCRFDIITIVGNKQKHKLEHIADAFYPTT
jgi:putative endonuclease